jgi:multiple sugar transport system substrate-binding protein
MARELGWQIDDDGIRRYWDGGAWLDAEPIVDEVIVESAPQVIEVITEEETVVPTPVVAAPVPVAPVAVPPIAEAVVEPVKRSLAWLWWLLGLLALAGIIFGITRACNRAPVPAVDPTVPAVTSPAVQPTPTATADANVAPFELTFRWWGGDARAERTMNAIAVCEAKVPGLTIRPLPVSFDGYYDALMVEFAAGTQPDIFQMDVGRPREFGPNGLLYPLNDIVNLTVSDSILEESSWEGEIFGAAATANAPSMLLNPRLFEEAGVAMPTEAIWTWDQFNTVTAELAANLPDGSWAVEFDPVNLMPAWITQRNSIGITNADTGEVHVDPALLAQYIDFYNSLSVEGKMPPASAAGETWTVGPEETLMGRGLAAITFVPSSGVTAFSSASGDDLVLARIPGDDSEAAIGTLVNIGIYWAISAETQHPEAAGTFVDCLINDKDAGEFLGVDRGVPLNVDVAAAITPGLDAVSQQQVEYMASVIGSGAGTNRGVPGQGQTPQFIRLAVQSVMFGQSSSLAAANQFISELQTAVDGARVN